MFPTISHEHKKVLWCSHKCGSTTVRKNYYLNVVGAKKQKESGRSLLYTSTLGIKERIVNVKYLKEYKNVLVVRNPYNRISSLYFNKYFAGLDKHVGLYKPKGFDQFLLDLKTQIVDKNFVGIDIRHSEPQFTNNYANDLEYTVYKLEDQLEEMFEKEFDVKIKNEGRYESIYSHLYTEANKNILKTIYKLDFDELEKLGIYYEI